MRLKEVERGGKKFSVVRVGAVAAIDKNRYAVTRSVP